MLKKIKQYFKKLKTTVILFDENKEEKIIYVKDLPKNINIFGENKSNIVRIHKNLIARNIIIMFTGEAKNCRCYLDDSQSSAGLDVRINYLSGENSELSIGKIQE